MDHILVHRDEALRVEQLVHDGADPLPPADLLLGGHPSVLVRSRGHLGREDRVAGPGREPQVLQEPPDRTDRLAEPAGRAEDVEVGVAQLRRIDVLLFAAEGTDPLPEPVELPEPLA